MTPADGEVILDAEALTLKDNLLMIDHGNGLNSTFLHSSRLLVKTGTSFVAAGGWKKSECPGAQSARASISR